MSSLTQFLSVFGCPVVVVRRAWDSNPRDISAHQFSRLAPSAARTALPAPDRNPAPPESNEPSSLGERLGAGVLRSGLAVHIRGQGHGAVGGGRRRTGGRSVRGRRLGGRSLRRRRLRGGRLRGG